MRSVPLWKARRPLYLYIRFRQTGNVARATFIIRIALNSIFNAMKLFATIHSYLPRMLRIALGIVMFPHGAQKVFGWFGGQGFEATMGGMSHQYGPFLSFLAILAEFAGSLGLLTGFLTRIAAFGVFCNMMVAIAA